MASRLDQALDEVIRERSGSGRSHNNNINDFTRRSQVDVNGVIRKRLGPSQTIKSFVRTVNVQGGDNFSRGSRNFNSQWSHDMFDDDRDSGSASIISRLGGRGGFYSNNNNNNTYNKGQEISVENLHYNVTEKDIQELFSTVADVVKAKLVFDISGRSTGIATVKYDSLSDAEKAIKKYNNVELDGQAMLIQLKEYTPRQSRVTTSGSRFNNNRLYNRSRNNNNDRNTRNNNNNNDRRNRNNGRDNGRSRDNSKKYDLTAENLDKEMDNYMKSNVTNNEDTDMILD